MADVAFALRDLFETGVDLSNPSFRAFIRGYCEHASLDAELISHLPTWMRLVNLITYAKLVRAMDLAHDQDYPQWCTSLLLKLEKQETELQSVSSLDPGVNPNVVPLKIAHVSWWATDERADLSGDVW